MATLFRKAPGSILVLLVEDNPGDAALIREAFKNSKRNIRVSLVKDGVEASDYLKGRGRFFSSERPDLVILDLNMPRKDGFELLREVKSDSELREIPMVVLSHSDSPSDIRRAYESRANFYLVKPEGFEELFKAMGRVEDIWLAGIEGDED